MAATLTTAQVAEELGTDPKTLRKFLRSDASPIEPVGQGGRYAISKAEMKDLRKAFAQVADKKVARAQKKETSPQVAEIVEELEIDDEELEEVE